MSPFLIKVKTNTQFDRRRRKHNWKIIKKYYFFVHVLVPHAKQFSKVDSPVIHPHVDSGPTPLRRSWMEGRGKEEGGKGGMDIKKVLKLSSQENPYEVL